MLRALEPSPGVEEDPDTPEFPDPRKRQHHHFVLHGPWEIRTCECGPGAAAIFSGVNGKLESRREGRVVPLVPWDAFGGAF